MTTVNESNSTIVVFTGATETVNGDDDLINAAGKRAQARADLIGFVLGDQRRSDLNPLHYLGSRPRRCPVSRT